MGAKVVSFERDRAAAADLRRHQERLLRVAEARVASLVTAAGLRRQPVAEVARLELVEWCRSALLPHAEAEERVLYPVGYADPAGQLLVEGMLSEHRTLLGLVDELDRAADLVEAVAGGSGLRHLLATHVAKENDLLLPLLARSPYVSLADLVTDPQTLCGDGDGAGR